MLSTKSKIEVPEFAPYMKMDAAVTTLDETAQIRSEARLEQIFAEARQQSPTVALPRHRVAAKTWALRLAAIPVAAAAIIGAVTILPHGAGTVAPALANWTAIPTSIADIPAAALASYNQACQEMFETGIFDNPILSGRGAFEPSVAPAEPTIVETRGDLTLLIYPVPDMRIEATRNLSEGRSSFICVIGTAPVPATVDQVVFVTLTNMDFGTFSSGWSEPGPNFVNLGTSTSQAGPTELLADSAIITKIISAAPLPREIYEAGPRAQLDFIESGRIRYRIFEGLVGENVAAVTLNTRGGDEIVTTVKDGWFGAWHPFADSIEGASTSALIESLTITLHDGTTFTETANQYIN